MPPTDREIFSVDPLNASATDVELMKERILKNVERLRRARPAYVLAQKKTKKKISPKKDT